MFGKLITGTEEFCAKIGSMKISFTALKCKIQIDDSTMNEVIKTLPESLKEDAPNMFHHLLVDWVGDGFKKEFLRVVGQELNSELPADSATDVKKRAIDKEENSRWVTQLSDEEISAQVHKFLGHALGRLLNEKCTAKNDESDDYDYSIAECLLESMIATREEGLKSLLLRDENFSMCYPKIVHLRVSKKDPGMKVRTLASKSYFEFGYDLMRSIITRMNENRLA